MSRMFDSVTLLTEVNNTSLTEKNTDNNLINHYFNVQSNSIYFFN